MQSNMRDNLSNYGAFGRGRLHSHGSRGCAFLFIFNGVSDCGLQKEYVITGSLTLVAQVL